MPPRWGLDVWLIHVSTQMPSLRDSKGLLEHARFVNRTRRGCKPRLPDLGPNLSFFLKLTPMVRLGNRTYRAWGNIELPKYFIKLHTGCDCLNTPFSIDISPRRGEETPEKSTYSKAHNYLYTPRRRVGNRSSFLQRVGNRSSLLQRVGNRSSLLQGS